LQVKLIRRKIMQYRQFGKLDFDVSALGFGAMRLPTKDGHVDEAEATKMLHYAIDHGVNYVDTAYAYHNGQSELWLGKALQGHYREHVKLATKLPSWLVKEAADFDRYLNEQLTRLQTDRIDFYLLHTLNEKFWPTLNNLGVLDWAERAVADGRIGYLGFSFHDKYPVFEEIVNAYDWTFCQIQYNYMDIENQAGTRGLQYAASKGLAVVIMEPLLGGRLVNPPQPIQDLWETAEQKRTAADWALQWLWHQPDVSVVLSGMTAMEHVQENVAYADLSGINTLTAAELARFDQVREKYQGLSPIPCTTCGYCLPCPNGVNIPRNFGVYNQGMMYDKPAWARAEYVWMETAYKRGIDAQDQRAAACIQCQVCEEKCPQHIPISQWMPVVHEVLGEGKPYRKSL
jgi:predicted aldo/keto reductase-like oxidoreductase